MSERIYHWHKIAESEAELFPNERKLVETTVAGKSICLTQTAAGMRACAAKCPHAGGKLAEGYVDALGNIVCPLHRYKFSLQNGRNISGEGYFLTVYPLESRPDGIFVGIPKIKAW